MTPSEVMVRMGEHAVSGDPHAVLVSIGLGSCIGLALIDRRAAFAGLAHIMLPAAPAVAQGAPAKFADLAVPRMLADLAELGVVKSRLEAVLVGGAQMFSFGTEGRMDIGSRNEEATRAALEVAGVPVRAAATGGAKGRTIRVHVADGLVRVKEAGGRDQDLFAARSQATGSAA